MDRVPQKVLISDEWTPEAWKLTVAALGKDYRSYKNFTAKLRVELDRHRFEGGGTAVDVGCGEGSFTECWLGMLTEADCKLPDVVHLIEENGDLLQEANRRLKNRFANIEFRLVHERLAKGNLDIIIPAASLVVASHVTYYLSEAELNDFFFDLSQRALVKGGLAWIIVRDRHCGMYRKRFELLRESGVADTQAEKFSDHVLFLVHQSGLLSKTLTHSIEVTTGNLTREEAKKVFYFLTHLKENDSDALNLSPDDWKFSETHILAAVPSNDRDESNSLVEEAESDDDARRLLAATYEILAREGFVVLDIQLARVQPVEVGTARRERQGVNIHRPRMINGVLFRWGWSWRKFEHLLQAYFDRHPSFLLFDCFFSPLRPPCVSDVLARLSVEPSYVPHADEFKRLDEIPQPLSWKNKWETSTFDIAWAEWCKIINERWCEIFEGEPEQKGKGDGVKNAALLCFAVPARLAEVSAQSVDDAMVVNTAAAIFGTVLTSLAPRTDLTSRQSRSHLAYSALCTAYREISPLMTAYVGELIYKEHANAVASLKEANAQLEAANVRLEDVRQTARELSLELNRIQPQVRRIVELTFAMNPLDIDDVRSIFNDKQIPIYPKNRNGTFVVLAAHDFQELKDEEKQKAWLGVAIHTLLGAQMRDDFQNGHVLFEAAENLLAHDDSSASPGLVRLLRCLVDSEATHLTPGQTTNTYERAFYFLRNLIRVPSKPEESPVFTFAARLLVQTLDERLTVRIVQQPGNLSNVQLTQQNFVDPAMRGVFYEPRFPVLPGITHAEWFTPLSLMICNPLGRYTNRNIYVRDVSVEPKVNFYEILCSFDTRNRQGGSIDEIEDTLAQVREIYPDQKKRSPGNLRALFWDWVSLERRSQRRISLQVTSSGLLATIS